jgi:hypothetical protein
MSSIRGRWARSRAVSVLGIAAIALGGCDVFATHYPAPPDPLRPTTVGVIAQTWQDSTGYHDTLVDGRTVDMPQNGRFKLIWGIARTGDLLLAGSAGDGFAAGLDPSSPGCWEAWGSPSDNRIVWDRGSSIEFLNGIDLPEAAAYHTDRAPWTVDGRLAWTYPDGDRASDFMAFCANERGEIESALDPRA